MIKYIIIFIGVIWVYLFSGIVAMSHANYQSEAKEEAVSKALAEAKRELKVAAMPAERQRKEEKAHKEETKPTKKPYKEPGIIEETKPTKKPYRELGITEGRAGFDKYYVQGEGFKVTDFLGVSLSVENIQEPKKIDDMVLITGQDFEDFRNVQTSDLRKMTRPLFTRSIAEQAILHYKDWPRLKYTHEEKDVLIQYANKDVNTWKSNEFDLLYGFNLFERNNFLILNPVYKSLTIVNENTGTTFENVNQYRLNYSIQASDTLEIFGQQSWETNKNTRSAEPSKNKTRYYRFELRKAFPDMKLRLTPGWYHGETTWMPNDAYQVKDELYLDIGKDLTSQLRGNWRIEYDIDELSRVSNSNITSDVLKFTNKLSYAVIEYLDVSLGLDYGNDLSYLNKFDYYSGYVELEYFKYGFLRWSIGWRYTEYPLLNHGFDTIYLKMYLFRF